MEKETENNICSCQARYAAVRANMMYCTFTHSFTHTSKFIWCCSNLARSDNGEMCAAIRIISLCPFCNKLLPTTDEFL